MTRCLPRVRVGANTLLLLAFLAIFDRSLAVLVPLAAALLHELGHIAVMLSCGVAVRRIDIGLFGAEISGDSIEGARKVVRIAVYAAGAAANLATGLIAELLGFEFFADCSYALAAVNLLPIKTLDGGCIVSTLLCDLTHGRIIAELLSGLSLFLLWLAASYLLLLCGGNLSLLAFMIYLFVTIYLS